MMIKIIMILEEKDDDDDDEILTIFVLIDLLYCRWGYIRCFSVH